LLAHGSRACCGGPSIVGCLRFGHSSLMRQSGRFLYRKRRLRTLGALS
jgi:hypothetical protein